jgi:hypothetical protein
VVEIAIARGATAPRPAAASCKSSTCCHEPT